MENVEFVWPPHTHMHTPSHTRTQQSAARYISKDSNSRQEVCVTIMMRYLGLTTLEIRRRLLKIAFMYKVVEGRVPATNNEHYLKFQTKTYYKSYTKAL